MVKNILPTIFTIVVFVVKPFKHFNNFCKKSISFNTYNARHMETSINLYSVGKAVKIEKLKDQESQIPKTEDTKVDGYKITSDLAVIILDTTELFSNHDTIPYKMLC